MKLPPKVSLDARRLARLIDFSTTSNLAGRVADFNAPSPMLKAMIEAYIRVFNVDMSEAARGIDQYTSFGDFFARELKPGARPIDERSDVLASPADGLLHNCGQVLNGTVEQVKGRTYRLGDLLDDPAEATRFEKGGFATIYLSPANYHRVHTPLAGTVLSARYVPGALYSVQPLVTGLLDNLFVANERIAIHMETAHGRVCVVMVAATIVGKVGLTFSSLQTNGPARLQKVDTLTKPLAMEKGAELGAFHIGSTVVLLTERPFEMLAPVQTPVRVGQGLFRF